MALSFTDKFSCNCSVLMLRRREVRCLDQWLCLTKLTKVTAQLRMFTSHPVTCTCMYIGGEDDGSTVDASKIQHLTSKLRVKSIIGKKWNENGKKKKGAEISYILHPCNPARLFSQGHLVRTVHSWQDWYWKCLWTTLTQGTWVWTQEIHFQTMAFHHPAIELLLKEMFHF